MRVSVTSPWYPDETSVFSGIFVAKKVRAVEMLGAEVTVEVPTLYPAPPGKIPKSVTGGMRSLAAKDITAAFNQIGNATWIPTPVPSGSGFAGRSEAFADSIRLKREFVPVRADVYHAHLAVPTGWALTHLGDAPLVVSEHQSTLDQIFVEPAATRMYEEVLRRADAFLCVSPALKDRLVDRFGDLAAEKIELVPNVVDLEDLPFAQHGSLDFDRWIYVGAIASHKGIPLLMESFLAYRREFDQGTTLTIVGSGPLESWVRRFAASKGMRSAVDVVGAIPHSEVGAMLESANVMVHLSPLETFGIASLEGLGAGLPVVSLRNGGADTAWGDHERYAGVLLPIDTRAKAVAKAVNQLKQRRDELDMARVRRMIEDRYSYAAIGENLMDIYSRVTL